MSAQPGHEGRPASELPLRLVSAIVLIGVAAVGEVVGGAFFAALVALVSAFIVYEWSKMVGPIQSRSIPKAVMAFAAITVVMAGNDPLSALTAMGMVFIGLLLASVTDRKLILLALGLLYAGLPGIAAVLLRGSAGPAEMSIGFSAIAFILIVVAMTDTAAYFTGRTLGGPKLWPAVSPKKTWSGAIGGIVGAVIGGVAFAAAVGLTNLPAIAVVSAVLAVAAEAGDLAESAMKRRFGIKDSGKIIPGHGGVMDRVDGHVVALVVAALIGLVRGGPEQLASGLLSW